MRKLTRKHFKYFKARCTYWQGVFGLSEWDIQYNMRRNLGKEMDRDACGETDADSETHRATIRLSPEIPDDEYVSISEYLDDTARHEIMEVMFWPLCHVELLEKMAVLLTRIEKTEEVADVISEELCIQKHAIFNRIVYAYKNIHKRKKPKS